MSQPPIVLVRPAALVITREGLTRAAARVKLWRRLRTMNQQTFARDHAHVSVGCLQGLESGERSVRPRQLAAIAAALNLTVEELVSVEAPGEKPDPRLKDLRDEDLLLAQAYHHAGAETKIALKEFLESTLTDAARARIARVLVRLMRFDLDVFTAVEAALHAIEHNLTTAAGPAPVAPPVQPATPARPSASPAVVDPRRRRQS